MAVVLITPVSTTTRGEYDAKITGIDPTDTEPPRLYRRPPGLSQAARA
jgi:hypothetical protein